MSRPRGVLHSVSEEQIAETGSLGPQLDMADMLSSYQALGLVRVQLKYMQQQLQHQQDGGGADGFPEVQAAVSSLEHLEQHLSNLVDNGAKDPIAMRLHEAPVRLVNSDKRVQLQPFERAQLASLVPFSLEEAVELIPSLRRYEAVDIARLVQEMTNGDDKD